jgi:hypothetical protein
MIRWGSVLQHDPRLGDPRLTRQTLRRHWSLGEINKRRRMPRVFFNTLSKSKSGTCSNLLIMQLQGRSRLLFQLSTSINRTLTRQFWGGTPRKSPHSYPVKVGLVWIVSCILTQVCLSSETTRIPAYASTLKALQLVLHSLGCN